MRRRTILLIDDEQSIADVVVYALEEHGFQTRVALDGDTGLKMFEADPPNLVLLDLNLPGLSGLELFTAIRAKQPDFPIIMLTSRSDEPDRVLGLEMGADDYVTKPFSPRELVARVKTVLRRTSPSHPASLAPFRHGPFELDEDAFRFTYCGVRLQLTRPEFRLLVQLLHHPARVFSREGLMRHIYEDDHLVTDRSIDAYIKRVRKKLHQIDDSVDPIETVYGVGYKLRHGLEDSP